jgi:branched-chain amino acid transport system ATP-binding protein
MLMAMMKVENVTKKFGALVAVDNVSFEVEKEETLGIIGPNGAGKTTLFNVISGELKPTSGKVYFMNRDITGKRPSKIVRMGLVKTFQIMRAFSEMSVLENVIAVNPDSLDVLKDFNLWDKRDMKASDLPQGELRKLGIAIAMATNPKMVLLDEPFSGLSPRESLELHNIIGKLREYGITMVIIEHKLKELFNEAERVICLNAGAILKEGTPDEVVKDPKVIEAYIGYSG